MSTRDELEEQVSAENFTVDAIETQDDIEAGQKRLNDEINKKLKRQAEHEEKELERAVTKAKVKKATSHMGGPSKTDISAMRKHQEKAEKDREASAIKGLEWKIGQYIRHFPGIASRLPKLSPKPTEAECLRMVDIIKEILSTQGSMATIAGYFYQGFTMTELFWGDGKDMTAVPPKLRLNLSNISVLFRDGKFPQLDPLIAELDVEYPWLGRRSLFMRLGSTIMDILFKVNLYNTNPAAAKMFEMESRGPVDVPDVEGL